MKWNDAEKVGCPKKTFGNNYSCIFKRSQWIWVPPELVKPILKQVFQQGGSNNPDRVNNGLSKLKYFSWPWLHFRED